MRKVILAIPAVLIVITIVLIVTGRITDAGLPMLAAFAAMALYGYYNKKYQKMAFMKQPGGSDPGRQCGSRYVGTRGD